MLLFEGNNKRNIFEGVFLTVMTLFFAVLGIYFPAVLVISVILASVPTAVMTVKWNRNFVGTALGSIFVLLLLIQGPLPSIQHLISFAAPGVAVGLLLRSKATFQKLLVASSFSYIMSFVLIAWFRVLVQRNNIIEEYVLSTLRESFTKIVGFFLTLMPFTLEPGQHAEIAESLTSLYSPFVPAGLIIASIVSAYIVLLLAKYLLKWMNIGIEEYGDFSALYLPRGIMLAMIASYLLFFLGGLGQAAQVAIANILVLLLFAYGVQGLSFIEFYLRKYRVTIVFRVVIYTVAFVLLAVVSLISLVFPLASMFSPASLMILLGIIDSSFGIRKKNVKGDANGQ